MLLGRTTALVLVLSALSHIGALASAQTYRLNAPFVKTGIVGDVQDFRVHPAGTDVLFRADTRFRGAFELYHVALNGSAAPVPIAALPVGHQVYAYAVSADGSWVVYLADRERAGTFELYAHRVGTFASTKISAPIAYGGSVNDFRITPDGARVIYHAQPSADFVFGLYSAPIDGSSEAVRLSLPSDIVGEFEIDATSTRVAYVLPLGASILGDLFSVPIAGGQPPTRLAQSIPGGFHISPDGSKVLYVGNFPADSGLYVTAIDGSSAPSLVTATGRHPLGNGSFSPDGARIVWSESGGSDPIQYRSRPRSGGASALLHSVAPPYASPSGTSERLLVTADSSRVVFVLGRSSGARGQFVFCAPIDGSAPAQQLDSSGSSNIADLTLSPDGRYAVYMTGSQGTGGGLRSMRLDGSAPATRIDDVGGQTGAVVGSFFVRKAPSFVITPDSRRVVYVWGTSSTDWSQQGLYSVPIERSSAPAQIRAGGASFVFGLDPAGTHVVFSASEGDSQVFELYVAGVTGGPARKLSGPLAQGRDGSISLSVSKPIALDAANGDVVYSARNGAEPLQLFRAPLSGKGPVTRLSATGVGRFVLSPDGTRVVYQRQDGALLSALARGTGAPVVLDVPLLTPNSIGVDFALSPDGTRVVYVNDGGHGNSPLRSVAITGGPPTTLGQGSSFRITADSTTVVFTTPNGVGFTDLARAPIVGGTAPVLIDGGVNDDRFELTPDGHGVVYVRYHPQPDIVQSLRSAPLDGSAPPLELAATGPAIDWLGVDLRSISPNGWAVFEGTAPAPSTAVGLYACRIDGSSGIVPLASAPSGQFAFPTVTSHATRVLYGVPLVPGERAYDLYSVPIDASAPPTKLNPPGSIVSSFTASADGAAVVFIADGVYSAPTDGSAAAVRLSSNASINWTFVQYKISPDSRSVLYSSDELTHFVFQLHEVPIDGSRAPLLLTPPLAGYGVLEMLDFTPDSSLVLFTGTRIPGVTELFASVIPEIPQQRHGARR